MVQANLSFTEDAELFLEKSGAAITASGLGSKPFVDLQDANWQGYMVADVSDINIDGVENEVYTLYFQGSNNPDFSGDLVTLGAIILGDKDAIGHSVDSKKGRYAIPVWNAYGDTTYRYVRLNVVVGGTTPSITMNVFLSMRG